LIYLDVERAVSRMQTVIELGRVARDRKTLPLKVHKNIFTEKKFPRCFKLM